jgi:hypothetical protein
MALCYKDRTFCDSNCANTKCFRFIYKGLWVEARNFGLPLAVADFSLDCEDYVKKE